VTIFCFSRSATREVSAAQEGNRDFSVDLYEMEAPADKVSGSIPSSRNILTLRHVSALRNSRLADG